MMAPRKLCRLFSFLIVLAVGLLLLYNRSLGLKARVTVTSGSKASSLSRPVSSVLVPLSMSSSPSSLSVSRHKNQCPDVLHNMLTGTWHQRLMTSEEVEKMRRFHKRVIQSFVYSIFLLIFSLIKS